MTHRAPSDDRREITVALEDPSLPYPYQDGGAFTEVDRSEQRRLKEALEALPEYRFEFLDRHETLAAELAGRRPGFVFNLCESGFRNRGELEAHVPALLEMLGIPYSGATPAGLLLCRDKALVRAAAAGLGVPVPAELYLDADNGDADGDVEAFPYPAIVKPNLEEGSRGVTAAAVVDGPAAAAARLRELRRDLPGSPLLLQEFLGGAEYSVGLVGNPQPGEPKHGEPGAGFIDLPIHEIDYADLDPELPPILSFAYKNDPGSRYASQVRYRPARLAPGAAAELWAQSCRLFGRLGCRDYARIDYRADGAGRIKLLEVNPNPAVTWKGSLQRIAAAGGYDYPAFLGLLLGAALRRCAEKESAPHA